LLAAARFAAEFGGFRADRSVGLSWTSETLLGAAAKFARNLKVLRFEGDLSVFQAQQHTDLRANWARVATCEAKFNLLSAAAA